ncbi:MAG: hypothetical protein KGL39_20010 [Patescibacteria group bacterium]|nr:hypothetical protein [Patescibacteria group bacterium]
MKKILLALFLGFLAKGVQAQNIPINSSSGTISPSGYAGSPFYTGYLANEAGLTFNNQYLLDLAQYAGSHVSAQVLFSSANYSNSTFTDGSYSTGTITVAQTGNSLAGVTITIGSVTHTFGVDIATGASTAAAATNLAAKINADPNLNTIIVATAPVGSSIVYSSGVVDGVQANLSISSGNYVVRSASITFGGVGGIGGLFGGTAPAYTLNSKQIYLPAHGFTNGLQVLYSTSSNVAISGLTTGTTYYVGAVGTNFVSLASSIANERAGTFITLASTTTANPANSFTLAPLAIAGSPTFIWQSSNDGKNWITAPSTGTVTILTSSAVVTNLGVDFGYYDYRYLRLNVTAPTAGGVFIQAPMNIKQDGIGPF